MLEFVEHLFTYQFLNRALITSIIVGIVCGTVGSFNCITWSFINGRCNSARNVPVVLPYHSYLVFNVCRRTYNWYDRKYFYRLYHLVVKRNLTHIIGIGLPLSMPNFGDYCVA